MVAKNKFLVVVATMEGRNFPKRSKYQLVIEARLDGELLATDPVDHVESPDFTQELAWEIDKKGLQQHRMQRTVIKVQCYAVDMLTTAREVIGYVMLDLRSARDKQAGKWYPLLHTKYPKLKPEILLSIYIDEDGTEDTGFKAAEAPARRGHLPPDSSTSEDVSVGYVNLRPILYEDQGYYQLGPEDVCAEFFTLSITVAFAANLTQLIPTSVPLPSSTGGYFFYFTLLGNDVTNESFFDLMNPNFPAERASVRLRSNVDALRSFFKKQPGIQVHLCCGDQSLGNAVIPLDSLLKKESTEIFMKPVSIEGAFELCPPNRWKSQMQPLPESLQPNVGVSVVLRKEIDELAAGNLKIAEETGEKARDQLPVDPAAGTASGGENKSANTADSAPGGALAEATSAPPGGDTDDDLSSMVAEKPLMDDGHQAKATVHLPAHLSVDDSHQVRFKSPMPQEAPLSYTPPHVAVPPHLRRYSFSVELATVRSLDVQHPVNIFLRYVYSFFGSSAPITTHPAVEARGNTQVTLPRSYCAFDFATTAQELKDTFHRIPLVIEVYDRSKQLNKDVLIGVSQLPLAAILDTKRSEAVRGVDGTPAQKLTGTIPILLPEGGGGKLGELDFTLILEDHGAYEPHTIQVPESTTESSETIHVEPAKKAPAPAASPRAPTESLEYRAAVELELWKAAQEKLFEAHLRERESAHMKALSAEWKKRDSERESVFQKRLSEYNMLEKQLKTAVADLNKREGQIKDVESEVTRLKADLQREHDMKLKELQEASKRVKEEADHRVHLERQKCAELEERITRLKSELAQADHKCQSLDQEFMAYKEKQGSRPEIKLQSEINVLTLEKAELERKLDSLSKSKLHYKQQWGKALKELARLKEREQATARRNLKKQQQELEHMRLRYLAAEERDIVQSEKQELAYIREQLNMLKDEQEKKQSQAVVGNPLSDQAVPGDRGRAGDGDSAYVSPEYQAKEEHIARLIEERDCLLRTGAYSHEDRIIVDLDRHIREAIAKPPL